MIMYLIKSTVLTQLFDSLFNSYKIQNKNISFAFLYFLKSSVYFIFCQFMVA